MTLGLLPVPYAKGPERSHTTHASGNRQNLVLAVDPELTCELAPASLDHCSGVSQGKATRSGQTVDSESPVTGLQPV